MTLQQTTLQRTTAPLTAAHSTAEHFTAEHLTATHLNIARDHYLSANGTFCLGQKELLNEFDTAFFDQDKSTKPTTKAQIIKLLNTFEHYQLHELNKANLMNRVDSKFLLPIAFLPALLAKLSQHYKVLDINEQRCFAYHNQYFDTLNMDFYHHHHNGKLNRYKVRRRRYVDTDTEFLEVKLKNNKQRTIKTRIALSNDTSTSYDCAEFIQQAMKGRNTNLDITQESGYNRIALANEEKAERLTLDFGLWYKNKRGNNQVNLPHFFIAELKQDKKSKQSPFYQLMSKHHIFPTSFSKYCIGCALLYPESIKTNRFKAILNQIKKFNRIMPTPTTQRN
ncbi:MAG: polyphosphate polymerase domain-containing protein [Thalassotalea sp.]